MFVLILISSDRNTFCKFQPVRGLHRQALGHEIKKLRDNIEIFTSFESRRLIIS